MLENAKMDQIEHSFIKKSFSAGFLMELRLSFIFLSVHQVPSTNFQIWICRIAIYVD